MSGSGDFAFHSWVDESMHVAAGLYILAAVVCDPGGCDPIRDTMRSLLDEGQPKLHWSGESPDRKEKIVGTVAQIDIAAVVVIGTPMAKKNQERARAVCMESMVVALTAMGVEQVLLEERTPSLNERDQLLIRSIRGKKLIPKAMRIEVGQPSAEPMLWVSDIVAGAVGADRVHDLPQYLDAIRPMVEVLDVPLR
jgi:hypothetical protein